MMKTLKHILIGAVVALTCFSSFAQDKPDLSKGVVIHPSIPPVTSAKDAPFAGWYELQAQGKTFYLSADGRFMMLGKVIDLGDKSAGFQQQSTTAAAPAKIDVSQLPVSSAIRFVNGSGKRKMFVFSDPDCPYCKQLEGELGSIQDATIYVFPYPLTQLHPQARAKSIGAWCQPDRAKAWKETVLGGKAYSGSCSNPVDSNVELGMKQLRIFSTPTIFNAEGARIEGYESPASINRFLK
jgi:thiol:disulfide interchange protein DsbC